MPGKKVSKVKIDFDKLNNVMKSRKTNLSQVSLRVGRANNYLTICKNKDNGRVNSVIWNLICDLYGLDGSEFVMVDEPKNDEVKINAVTSKSVESDLLDLIKTVVSNQKEIIRLLEIRERQNIMLTAQEDIVLLLQQMLRHGACIEEQFKQKAKQLGYDIKLVNYAIEFCECKREVVNGKVWLKKK